MQISEFMASGQITRAAPTHPIAIPVVLMMNLRYSIKISFCYSTSVSSLSMEKIIRNNPSWSYSHHNGVDLRPSKILEGGMADAGLPKRQWLKVLGTWMEQTWNLLRVRAQPAWIFWSSPRPEERYRPHPDSRESRFVWVFHFKDRSDSGSIRYI